MAKLKGAFYGGVKKVIRNVPGVKGILNRIDFAEKQSVSALEQINTLNTRISNAEAHIGNLFDQLSYANNKIAEQEATIKNLQSALYTIAKKEQKNAITQRLLIKSEKGATINVVFLIEEPSVTKNILPIIDELHNDDRFDVMLVNLWYKSYKDGDYTYVRPKIETVIDTSKYNFLEAYDEENDKWLDLECLIPDYVFFSRPYDYYRNEAYHIGEVAKYARTCYVPYGIQTVGGEVEKMVLTPECSNLYYFFLDNSVRYEFVNDVLGKTDFAIYGHSVYLGYPGIDMLLNNPQIKKTNDNFNVLWLPRWNSGENNCHFFEFCDFLANYANSFENCSVTLRPHPLCFNHFLDTGELTEEKLADIRNSYSGKNEIDEKSSYIDAFTNSSVLVADETSLIAEYFITEKPIVFCKKETHFSALMEKLIEGCYIVSNQDELEAVLNNLMNGVDPLKSKRAELAKQYLTDYKDTAAKNIKEALCDDFKGKYLF